MANDGRLSDGRRAEDAVARWVLSRGWTLLGRRCRTPHGELDVVALDGEVLVIVEVKYRRRGDPAETVTPRKRSRLRRAAEEFAVAHGLDRRDRRFDIAAVTPAGVEYVEGVDLGPTEPFMDDSGPEDDWV